MFYPWPPPTPGIRFNNTVDTNKPNLFSPSLLLKHIPNVGRRVQLYQLKINEIHLQKISLPFYFVVVG